MGSIAHEPGVVALTERQAPRRPLTLESMRTVG